MKRFLQTLILACLSFAMVGCYEDSVGPEVPIVGSLTLSQEQLSVGAEGGDYSVDIYTEYAYQASANVNWIEFSGGSCGTECCTQYFTVKANNTTSSREGVITVFCDDYNLSATLTVMQEAGSEQGSGSSIPNNQIWYTSTDGEIVTPVSSDVFGANIVSNTYENGQGIIEFNGPITKIGEKAFYAKEEADAGRRLTSITIPNSVTSIGNYAFYRCSSLTNINIPNGVTSIGNYAFYQCEVLESVTIPNSVTKIGKTAFFNCGSLTSVTIPDSVAELGEHSFASCEKLEYFYGKFASDDNRCLIVDNTINTYASGSTLSSYTIPKNITAIGSCAFQNCDYINSVIIPEGVIEIGYQAFHHCSKLSSVYCKPATPPTGGSSMFGYNPSSRTIYVSQDSVVAYKSAEYWSEYADKIVGYDFELIDNTSSRVILYTSTDGKIVEPYATDVFGANIVSNTYENGQGVITFDGAVMQIGNKAFYAKEKADAGRRLTSITIPDSVTSIGNYAFYQCSSLTNINIPNGVTSIGSYAFYQCSALESINIPSGVTSIGSQAFYQCHALANVDIPNSVATIGDAAFWACHSFTSVTIPDSVTKLGSSAFACCKKLEYFYGKFASSDNRALIVDNTLNSFAAGAAIESYTIPESITTIGRNAFQNSQYLQTVTIPEGVTEIGFQAFYGCKSLKEVYCKPTTPPLGGNNMFMSNASNRKIYIPGASVNLYKSAQYWSDYADQIYAEPGTETTPTDTVAVPEDKYPSKTNFKRRILVTQFTGTGCGHCPRIVNALYQLNSSDYADDVVLTAAHLYNSSDPAYLSSAADLDSSLSITSFPKVCIDLDKSATTGSSYSSIVDLVSNAQSRVAVKGGIAVNSKYNAETGTININVLVKAKESAEFRVGAWLLEDGVYGEQNNSGYTPLDGVDFNTHNNCVRTAFSSSSSSDYTGYSLGTIEAGKSASREFLFGLKSNGTGSQTNWNHDNLRLVVFISTKEGKNWLVNNVVKAPKSGSVDFEYLD